MIKTVQGLLKPPHGHQCIPTIRECVRILWAQFDNVIKTCNGFIESQKVMKHDATVHMTFQGVFLDSEEFIQGGQRLFLATQLTQYNGAIDERIGIPWFENQGILVMGQGLLRPIQIPQRNAPIQMGQGRLGVDPESLPDDLGPGLVVIALILNDAEAMHGREVIGFHRQNVVNRQNY
jgi:hypothetical protein